MNRDFISRYWYAYIYEQQENHTYDVEFYLRLLDEQFSGEPQRILEVACGGGRICVPLAQAGHQVTGFDADEYMLARCYRRMKGLDNLRCYQADATEADWGKDFDVVLLGGNILINIEADMDYERSQIRFIQNAASALRSGGHLCMSFDLHNDPGKFFNSLRESSYFSGYDDLGTYGRTMGYGGVYDPETRIAVGASHLEIIANNGQRFIEPRKTWYKHIPSQDQVYGWLNNTGLVIERTHKNWTDEPVERPVEQYCHATIWARKI